MGPLPSWKHGPLLLPRFCPGGLSVYFGFTRSSTACQPWTDLSDDNPHHIFTSALCMSHYTECPCSCPFPICPCLSPPPLCTRSFCHLNLSFQPVVTFFWPLQLSSTSSFTVKMSVIQSLYSVYATETSVQVPLTAAPVMVLFLPWSYASALSTQFNSWLTLLCCLGIKLSIDHCALSRQINSYINYV